MKVLIADDERIECVALEKMIRELIPSLNVLPSAHDGMEFVRRVEELHPDIAIVDIQMPNLNGLDALEILRMKHCEMEIIIHTAYDEFEYLHRAMHAGAYEFLVKPVTEDQLVQTMLQAMAEVRKKQAMQIQMPKPAISEEMMQMIGSSIMMSLLLNSPDVNAYQMWQSLYQTGDGEGVIVSIRATQGRLPATLAETLGGMADRRCIALQYARQEKIYLYLFTLGVTDENRYRSWLQKWLSTCCNELFEKYHCTLICGISGYKKNFEDMGVALIEAEHANKTVLEGGIYFYKQKQIQKNRCDAFGDDAATVAEDLRQGNYARAKDRLCGRMRTLCTDTACTEEQTELYVSLKYALQLVRLFQTVARRMRLETRKTGTRWSMQELVKEMLDIYGFGQEEDVHRFNAAAELQTIEAYIDRIIKRMENDLRLPEIQTSPAVESAIHYIEQNYANEISMEDTAEHALVSRFYLGRLLKQERDLTFQELLTDTRIDWAIRYLEEGLMTNQEIAILVGYHTVEYFQQVFKRKLGISPGDYRKALDA